MTAISDEVMQLIKNRDNRLVDWLKNKSPKLSLAELKNEFKQWWKEIDDSRKFAKDVTPRHTKGDLDFAYTFMNEFSAFHSHHCVAIVYIKKLEEELRAYIRQDLAKEGPKEEEQKSQSSGKT